MDLEKYIKEDINMEVISWIMFVNGILLGWWLPIISKLLFIELPVSLRLSREAMYKERRPFNEK
tara:strand:- start:301 stop:492 length:192 start_codon:yes stop_codon:yes gene_type:complete